MESLKASKAYRWVNCPGSHTLEPQFPDAWKDTEARDKGIEEHDIAAKILTGVHPGKPVPGPVTTYVEDVNSEVTDRRMLQVEHRTSISDLGITLNIVIDAWYSDPSKRRVVIWEYKSGMTPVYASKNWQLLIYACALSNHFTEQFDFDLRVVQPRIRKKPDRIVIPGIMLRTYRNQIFSAAAEAMGENPRCHSGVWCHMCNAMSHCHTCIEATAIAQAYSSYAIVEDRPNHVLGNDLALLRGAHSMIGKMINALEDRLFNEIKLGNSVIGWTLGRGYDSISWQDNRQKEILSLGQLYGIDLDQHKLMTPKQAIAAGVPESLVNAYAKIVPGKLTLKESEDQDLINLFKGE